MAAKKQKKNYEKQIADRLAGAMVLAAGKGDLQRLELLLKAGGDINGKDQYGEYPLHAACVKDSMEMVKFLVSHGADVNVQSRSGATVLNYVCAQGKMEIVRLLLEAGADPNISRDTGQTPLHALLSIRARANENEQELAELLLEHGADVNARDASLATPLLYACGGKHTSDGGIRLRTVSYLLSAGACVNIENNSGITPLHWACSQGDTALVNILLEAGARADKGDVHGYTPVDRAIGLSLTHPAREEILDLFRPRKQNLTLNRPATSIVCLSIFLTSAQPTRSGTTNCVAQWSPVIPVLSKSCF